MCVYDEVEGGEICLRPARQGPPLVCITECDKPASLASPAVDTEQHTQLVGNWVSRLSAKKKRGPPCPESNSSQAGTVDLKKKDWRVARDFFLLRCMSECVRARANSPVAHTNKVI